MKAVSKSVKREQYASLDAFNLDKNASGKMANALDKNIQTPEFGNLEFFREFRREQFRNSFIDLILEEGHADLFHIDNAYEGVGIVDSEHGNVLTIGVNSTVKDLSDLYEKLVSKSKKKDA